MTALAVSAASSGSNAGRTFQDEIRLLVLTAMPGAIDIWRTARELVRRRGNETTRYAAQKAAEARDENPQGILARGRAYGQGAADRGRATWDDAALTRKPVSAGRLWVGGFCFTSSETLRWREGRP
jgi:hypothetical protein